MRLGQNMRVVQTEEVHFFAFGVNFGAIYLSSHRPKSLNLNLFCNGCCQAHVMWKTINVDGGDGIQPLPDGPTIQVYK